MKNFVQDGHVMTVPAPYSVMSGAGVLVGSLFGVAAYSAAQGTPVEIATGGVFDLPKAAGDTPAIGGKLYWNDGTKAVSTSAGGNTLIGVAAMPALGDAAVSRIRLNGFIQ
ncbi:DUF2190 family protein [Methylobacterium sp. WL8]|uniref:DUF2190 family protein n=1 Tax=Methylobacterium sp. WL8 TaxID=2603899 RepID=UPI0011C93CE9|nr:DUF2190 family protein [Methylobacterium sp. WL8]TXN80380.1 DUF2190 family protein [Methylobacterium sp. WL8]